MGLYEALQQRLSQTVETVTRSSRIDIVGAGVDEIDPPEDIDEFAEQAKTNAIARANLRKFVHDVWEPGYRVEGPDETVAFFEGEQEDVDAQPPEITPEGGFLNNSAVLGGERYQDFYDFGKECSWQRWARGTVLVEYLKQDPEDAESMISGFNFIRPETVYPQVQNNTNILLEPDFDDLPDDVARKDVTFTRRDEVAAYIQFDDESILGLRNNGFSEQDVPLSQNDVLKQTLEPDIGGDIQKGEGVFGTSALEPVSEDIAEYEQMKSDRAEAIQRKAYGIWTAQFTPETIDLGDGGVEIIEWRDDAISDTEGELNQMGPGDVLTTDAGIDLERHDGDVPDLDPVLMHYVKTISSALPTPLPLAVDFAGDINRDVTGDQKDGFAQTVSEARKYQETSWTQALRLIAKRAGLPTEGLQLKIRPKREENPVKSLTDEEISRMNTYISTLATAAGPQAGPTALVDREAILEVMDFPVEEMSPEDMAEEVDDEEAAEAWQDLMLPEALAEFDDGASVDTPDGFGIIDDIITEGSVDDMDASDDDPMYAVVVEDESVGVGFYREGDLSDASVDDLPGPDDPTSELEAMADIHNATGDTEALQDGFFEWPESWEDSEQPARVIALKAWAGMGGSFTGCTREMRGSLTGSPDRFCADFKDRLYGTEQWRGGWGNEALAGQSGTEPFANNPVVPTGIEELTPAWLIRWAEWVAAGKPEIPEDEALAWNPALHPRNPENGKFVERPFNVPDDMPDLSDSSPVEILGFISDTGGDVDAVLNSDISIDGVPDDINTLSELRGEETRRRQERTGGYNEVSDETGVELAKQIPTSAERQEIVTEDNGAPITDELAETIHETTGEVLARANDESLAREYVRRTGYIGDESQRKASYNGPVSLQPGMGQRMVMAGDDKETIRHEMGHGIAQSFGFNDQDTSFAWDREYWPKEGSDPDELKSLLVGRDNVDAVGFDEWQDDVDGEILGPSFRGPQADLENMGPGDLLKFEDSPSIFTDSEVWEITGVSEGASRGVDYEIRDKTGFTDTVKIRGGEAFGDDVENTLKGFSDPERAEAGEDTEFTGRPIEQIEQAQERVSELNAEEKVREYVSQANRAFYKMHQASDRLGQRAREQHTIKDAYSSTNAHETISQMNEVMQTDIDHVAREAAQKLSSHHPQLLGTYMAMFDPSPTMRDKLNEEVPGLD